MRIAESDIEKHKNMSGKRKEEPEIAVVAKDWYAECLSIIHSLAPIALVNN